MSDKKQSRPAPPPARPPATQRPPLRESTRDTGTRINEKSNVRKHDQTISFSPPPPPPPRPKE